MKRAVHHHVFPTTLGACGVAWSERGLAALQLPEADREATERRLAARSASAGPADPPHMVATLIADVQHYLAGDRIDFSGAAVDLDGVEPVRCSIYQALRAIGYGHTATYGELAHAAGLAGAEAARDVGVAMARNPVPLVIPCHRVLAAGGKLGGFSAYGGALTKEKLLALEGVHFDGGAPRLPGL
jgi:methylated-DNA-[protein]-cysteine S-methyltransferase